jgi:peptidoglycan-associated lipoprotein
MKRLLLPTLALAVGIACGGKTPPSTVSSSGSAFPGAVDPAATTTPSGSGSATRVLPPPPPMTNPGAVTGSTMPSAASIDAINDNSPLKPVFFQYDSDTLDDEARKVLTENAAVLKSNGTWTITVEGHCDERGTAEYNLALGDRRALAARDYLVSLGVAPDRLSTVSYGKEFPFDAGHTESSWLQNRRAHFLLTAK